MINKKILIALVIFSHLFFLMTNSQTFEKYYKTDVDDQSPDAIELSNGDFVVVINRGPYFWHVDDVMLLRLNSSGISIDSVIYEGPEDYNHWGINSIYPLGDSIFLCISVCEDTQQNQYLNFIKFNHQLELVSDTIVGNTIPELFLLYYTRTHDNKITIAATETANNVFFLYEFDLISNALSYHPIIDTGGTFTHHPYVVHDIPGKNKYHVYMSDLFRSIYEINREDYSIDTTYYNTPQAVIPRTSAKGFNDSTYLFAGQHYAVGQDVISPTLSTMGIDGEIINYTNFIFQNDTNTFISQKCLAANDSRIYYAVTYNYVPFEPFFIYPQRRWIWLMCLYPDGTIDWQYFYKGEVNYMPEKVLPTSDGGALIISGKYDWNDPIPFQRDIHILKVDSTGWYEGLTTGTTEFDNPKQVLVYPNPFVDRVNFVLGKYSNLELSLYNSNGIKVTSLFLENSKSLDLVDLSRGLYVYILTGENGFIEKGKLVKE